MPSQAMMPHTGLGFDQSGGEMFSPDPFHSLANGKPSLGEKVAVLKKILYRVQVAWRSGFPTWRIVIMSVTHAHYLKGFGLVFGSELDP